jgi:hypothetical protein
MARTDQLRELSTTFGDLYDQLKDAYWAASTVEAKDEISGALDVTRDVIDALNQIGLDDDNADLNSLKGTLGTATKDLADLQGKVDRIVHNVAIATTTIDGLNRALTIAGKVMAF